ncbi:hypothetical protein JG687_00013648 [Phytophthora cactorum]|uniref:Uncharacterized protein n=1 Tax=Phytophthora cactorum TaxID=29920 RepID=A0A329SBG4_9STRA|nr:hypothetical protein Pcac1_g4324 [Phytophthora cactorum]KAG2829977.1 hypothetical protein PC111_g7552 [Phytophthora cactorum]KAG2885106.1 hypothetical protein PC114_g19837 [Phytophthora cactorum]KAG3184310.1 hypothetical protein PC128_g13787 [Phytophthora cactorum]KAG3215011.1 hypothetical protein PC129_g14101 [Phytophthora cactorum]
MVGLGPWTEQFLYRLKLQAYSVYDPTQGVPDCPYPGCERLERVDLHHDCPATTRLRRRFIRSWERAGRQAELLEVTCYNLTLPTVPAGVWLEVDQRFGGLKDAESEGLTVVVTKVAESCWRTGVALYNHAAGDGGSRISMQ